MSDMLYSDVTVGFYDGDPLEAKIDFEPLRSGGGRGHIILGSADRMVTIFASVAQFEELAQRILQHAQDFHVAQLAETVLIEPAPAAGLRKAVS